jgi:hypothetical protein
VLATWSNFSKPHKHGNSFDFGRFDECVALRINDISHQHCLIQYHYKPSSPHQIFPVPPNSSFFNEQWRGLSNRFGGAICLPSSCSGDDAEELVDAMFDGSDFMLTRDYDQSKFCHGPKNGVKFEKIKIIFYG